MGRTFARERKRQPQKNGKSSRVKKDARMREVEARSRRGGWIVVTVRDCREKKSKDKKGDFSWAGGKRAVVIAKWKLQ